MSSQSQHLDPETLAAFAEGRLDAAKRGDVIAHLDQCEECLNDVALVMPSARAESEKRRFLRPSWIVALAAAIVLAIALPLLQHAMHPNSPTDALVALAPRSARLVEPRLTGGFPWAGYHGPNRAADSATNAQQLKLGGAAGELIERAEHDASSDALHAAGVAMVMVEKPDEAIVKLESAARASHDAKPWSDLAAARYAAASKLGRASLYPEALAAADAALRIDPNLPEALFNRALILDRLGLSNEARHAWERYLEVDPSSQWAVEARERLAAIPVTTRSSQFDRDRPLLEEAAARGDASTVRRFVNAHRDRARAYTEGEYLGHWGEAVQKKDVASAARWLTIARNIATALTELSGDSLTSEAVQSIDNASASGRESIAAAHVLYRSGRVAYSRHDLASAQRDLLRAAGMFEAAHDPVALTARYYAASVRLAQGETTAARADLERIRAGADANPTFINLGAHVRWELGRIHILNDDLSAAVPVLAEGATMFRRSGDGADEAFIEVLLARALAFTGRVDEEWLTRMRAFTALSAEGENELLSTSVDAAMRAELHAGRNKAALALSSVELSVARACGKPHLVLDALVNQAMLLSATGNLDEARHAARQAEETAQAAGDDQAQRDWYLANVATATGAALMADQPRVAAGHLTRAIAFYSQHDLPFALPEPLLLRSRCAARMGDTAGAMRDLEQGIAIIERNRTIGPQGGMLDAEHALFTDAIRISLDRGDTVGAFAFGERSHGGSDTILDLQRRLAGSGVAVLEIVVLPDEVVTFAVTERDSRVGHRTRPIETLPALAGQSISEDGTAAASALYDDLIRPVDPVLEGVREIIVVPDAKLRTVAFAALYDTGTRRYLVERFAVAIATASSSLRREGVSTAAPMLAAFALPSAGASESTGLPDAAREIGDITTLYRHARVVTQAQATLAELRRAVASSDVLHIAGHTESQPGGGEQALLFANSSGTGVERVTGRAILAQPATHASVVVLAACNTLQPAASAATHALSLGEAFVAAGAANVIGTLAPIADRDARLLFRAFHRQIANGVQIADALRSAQQEAIADNPERSGRRPWRAVALLTRTIPAPNGGKENYESRPVHAQD
ncbi:MAG: hypothetical protein QOC81_4997 [Thermoanaerobaculia bacterium]|jgi:CHAT domain-containing protein/tetratricopeptide (TPR) repeat protein|nr:hypothetical protein [Thermoanaerobaculia bacterium]